MFWRDFFLRAVGSHSEGACSLSDYLTDSGVELLECDSLEVRFWPSHRSFGTPDLCLCFSGARTLPSVIMVEAKLGAGKSGAGEDDQLLRYLLLLRQLDELELPFRAADRKRAVKALLFLTPHDSVAEINETAELCAPYAGLKHLLFRAQWQDIQAAASACASGASGHTRVILHDISGSCDVETSSTLPGSANRLAADYRAWRVLWTEGHLWAVPDTAAGRRSRILLQKTAPNE